MMYNNMVSLCMLLQVLKFRLKMRAKICLGGGWRLPGWGLAFAWVGVGVCLGVLPFFIFILWRFTLACHCVGLFKNSLIWHFTFPV